MVTRSLPIHADPILYVVSADRRMVIIAVCFWQQVLTVSGQDMGFLLVE